MMRAIFVAAFLLRSTLMCSAEEPLEAALPFAKGRTVYGLAGFAALFPRQLK